MKQSITAKQLNELSDGSKEKLREWWKPKEGDLYLSVQTALSWNQKKLPKPFKSVFKNGSPYEDEISIAYPLLSIGQMIEFINDNDQNWRLDSCLTGSIIIYACDDLWEVVKEVLEK